MPGEITVERKWSSRAGFLFASVGVTVGLGNLWRFPFMAGENGGAAFVAVYLAAVALIGIPLIVAEMIIGRRGGRSAVGTMGRLVRERRASPFWKLIGALSLIVPFFGLTYYAVVAGWTVDYLVQSLAGGFGDFNADLSRAANDKLQAAPWRMILSHTAFILLTIYIVRRGLNEGLEPATKIMLPALFVLLLILVVYAMINGDSAAALDFLFALEFSKITPQVVFMALGQAFFSMAIGVGAMITYAAYGPKVTDLGTSAGFIAGADATVALLAGLAIFPIVFAAGLSQSEGPDLLFVAMPVAFGNMPGGLFFAPLFFLLLFVAALTSSIGMLEPVVAWAEEHKGWERRRSSIFIGGLAWLIGLSAVLSFNVWRDVRLFGFLNMFEDFNIFRTIDFFVANLMIPLNGLLIALFTGWVLSREEVRDELAAAGRLVFAYFFFAIRYLAPAVILIILVANLLG
jgi:NSS family neurotransmitter:Na+ symporter